MLIFGGRIWPRLSSQPRNNEIRKLQQLKRIPWCQSRQQQLPAQFLTKSENVTGAFSLTWPGAKQTYWNKIKDLHKKRVQLPRDWFGTPTWPPFYCFGTPIWPPRRHVKTLYRVIGLATVAVKTLDSTILRINHNTEDNYLGNSLGVVI